MNQKTTWDFFGYTIALSFMNLLISHPYICFFHAPMHACMSSETILLLIRITKLLRSATPFLPVCDSSALLRPRDSVQSALPSLVRPCFPV